MGLSDFLRKTKGSTTSAGSGPEAIGKSVSSWERKRPSAKNCTQVIFQDAKPVPTQPKVKHQSMNAPLMACTWGLWPVKLADSDPMDLYAKASGIAGQLESLRCRFAFACYPFPAAGEIGVSSYFSHGDRKQKN